MTVRTIKTSYEIGILFRTTFRRILAKMAFEIPTVRYIESKGFLESTFFVEGPSDVIEMINRWIKEMNER